MSVLSNTLGAVKATAGFLAKPVWWTANMLWGDNLKELSEIATKVDLLSTEYANLTNEELQNKTKEFKAMIEKGFTLDEIMISAFATAREAAKRVLNEYPYLVQIMGAAALHKGMIAEMKTGEGKTLVSSIAVYLNALDGKGMHVITVNDYLAKRDSKWMGQIFEFLGLSVGCIEHDMSSTQRKIEYAKDITYCTNNELGFDYLRDNMAISADDQCLRGLNTCIIDEVDSILIDEARTPLIISGQSQDPSAMYTWVNNILQRFLTEDDYAKDEKDKNVHFTEAGIQKIEKILRQDGVLEKNQSMYDSNNVLLIHHLNQALKAHTLFKLDKDYILRNTIAKDAFGNDRSDDEGNLIYTKELMIVDEFTGRVMEGRRYSDGLHQALEAKENLDIRPDNQTLASITFQKLFRMYNKLSGMTGTAATEKREFDVVYNLKIASIPTHRKVQRIDHDDEIYVTFQEKVDAIINLIYSRNIKYMVRFCDQLNKKLIIVSNSEDETQKVSNILLNEKYTVMKENTNLSNLFESYSIIVMSQSQLDTYKNKIDSNIKIIYAKHHGQPMLIGVSSVEKSEQFSEILKKAEIDHDVLNAKAHEREAKIIANAGRMEAISIVTNMAGRGTDIKLGGNIDVLTKERINKTGEEYETANEYIKNQVETEKQLVLNTGGLFIIGTERHENRRIDDQLRGRSGRQGDVGESKFFLSLDDDLMRIFASTNLASMLKTFGLQYGEAVTHSMVTSAISGAQERVEAHNFDIRQQIKKYSDVKEKQMETCYKYRNEILHSNNVLPNFYDICTNVIHDMIERYVPNNNKKFIQYLQDEYDIYIDETILNQEHDDIAEHIYAIIHTKLDKFKEIYSSITNQAIISIIIQKLDNNWQAHVQNLTYLEQIIRLAGYGQKDPLVEYKKEAFAIFEQMWNRFQEESLQSLLINIKRMENENLSETISKQVEAIEEEMQSNLSSLKSNIESENLDFAEEFEDESFDDDEEYDENFEKSIKHESAENNK